MLDDSKTKEVKKSVFHPASKDQRRASAPILHLSALKHDTNVKFLGYEDL
jgi:hypothetical protein